MRPSTGRHMAISLADLPAAAGSEPDVDDFSRRVRVVRDVVAATVRRKGPKRVASLAGRKGENADKVLNAALAGRDGNMLRAEDIFAAVELDESGQVLQAIADLSGAEVRMPARLSDAEKLERVYRFIGEVLSPSVVTKARAYAEGRR